MFDALGVGVVNTAQVVPPLGVRPHEWLVWLGVSILLRSIIVPAAFDSNTTSIFWVCVILKLVCILLPVPVLRPEHHIRKKPLAAMVLPAGNVHFIGSATRSLRCQPLKLTGTAVVLNNSIQSS